MLKVLKNGFSGDTDQIKIDAETIANSLAQQVLISLEKMTDWQK